MTVTPQDLPPELVCPGCLGQLTARGAHGPQIGPQIGPQSGPLPSLACDTCERVYSAEPGYLDFIGRESGLSGARGLGPRLMHSRVLASVYERLWRPLFVALASGGRPNYAGELEHVFAALAPAEGGVIADLSCGPGFTGRRLAASHRFARVYGVDWSVPMLRRALAAKDPALPLLRADVSHLPFARESLAGIHAGAALHVWPDPLSAIAEAARVLRPGGVLVASTFVHLPGGPLRPIAGTFQAISSARVFEVEELAGMCRAHGLLDFTPERRGALIMFSATRGHAVTPMHATGKPSRA